MYKFFVFMTIGLLLFHSQVNTIAFSPIAQTSTLENIEIINPSEIETISPEPNQELLPDGVISVGAGSYTDVPLGGTPGSTVWKTSNYNDPVQTADWVSSVLFETYSHPLFAHPLSYRAVATGLEVGIPPNAGGGDFPHRSDFIVGSSTFDPQNASIDGLSDWFADIVMANGADSLKASIGHGSPFVYFDLNSGDAKFTFVGGITVFSSNAQYLGITTSYGNHFGLFAPSGSSFNGAINGSTEITIALSDSYFSVVGLPDNTLTTLDFFYDYAYAFITDTQVDWDYDGSGTVTSTYMVTTTIKEGSNSDTILALYPHQWRDNSDPSYLLHTYPTIRGVMKTILGLSFQTSYSYNGILPVFPDQSNFDYDLLSDLVDEAIIGLDLSGSTDTYWGGKEVGRLAQLLPIAEQVGNTLAADRIIDALKGELEEWLTASGNEDFYYDDTWNTLIGYPASFGSDTSLNDHHFHYGYWIQAAAQIALRDPTWASEDQWGGMINLLIRDFASPSRSDSMFPILRYFDIYEGHSWASGTAQYEWGNNQESSSEAMNAWSALILWGEATGNTEIRDAGVYLYTTESEAINNYYFDVHEDIFDPSYDHVMTSLVFGGKYDYATWFSGHPHMIHGIVLLPFTAGSVYLGKYPDYVQRNYDAAYEARNDNVWADLLTNYLALTDPGAAINAANNLNLWEVGGGYDPEEGESKAHTYHWVHGLANMGLPQFDITANTTLYNVFANGVQKTYVVYNAQDTPITVEFTDGFVLTDIQPNSLVRQQFVDGPSYTLTTSVVGEGRISPSEGIFAANSTQTINAIASTGWTFDHWEGDVTGTNPTINIEMDSDKTITAIFVEAPVISNLALNKPVTVSSSESGTLSGDKAVDGDPNTRWASEFSDDQWIYIDLQQLYFVDRVVLNWEAAYASSYEIQVFGAGNWVTVYSDTNGNGGIDDISFESSETRFVRMQGITRATEFGYSLYEFEVYASPDQYTLTTNVIGSGTISPAGGTYDDGTVIQLSAIPSDGWTFVRWEGDITGSQNVTSLSMNSDKNVTAIFQEIANTGSVSTTDDITDDPISSTTEDTETTESSTNLRVFVVVLLAISLLYFKKRKM